MSPQSNPKSPSQIVAELLLRNKVLTREQLQSAVSEARSQGRGLTYTLVSLGLIQEAVLLRLLSQIFKVRAVELSKIERIDPRVLATVSADVAGRGLVLPIHRSGDTLTVAMVNPTNRATVQQLGQLTGLTIQPVIATEFALRSAIPKHYNADQPQPRPQPQAKPQTQPQPSGKLRMQTRSRHTQRQRASAAAAPPPAPAAPAQPPTPAVVPAPVIPSARDVPASAPNPAAPAAPAPAAQSHGEEADPDELLRKQMEAEVALANMSFRGEKMGDEGSGKKLIAIGAAMLLGGGLLTCASNNAAGDGGSFVVTTGLFIAGAVFVFRGLTANWSP
ncbi:MAG: hypothetical protein GTO46_03675 [Gemmatimonadetes bacterium]|nr:hypothetical protein [Gemmatimonadota bacterium]NIO32900.1 hypothetical protein [Gemmatimonadota bacterium]